jgi:beta-galactosidase
VWADCFTAPDKNAWLKFYRDKHVTNVRFWGTSWQGLPPGPALDFFDANGVLCRRSGTLDGEAIGYMAIENDPELKKLYGSEVKLDLMKNWLDQVAAQVKGERNHPSVMLWSIENEWLYINCINLYGGLMDKFEAEVKKVSDAVRAVDPTRLTMTDGGGANKDHAMPVHGNHYVWGNITQYPDLAYAANPTGGGRGRWTWDEQQPRFIGEDYFIAGHHPELSYIGGEAVFGGKAASLPAAGLMARILTEGYRWAGTGGFHFWMGQSDTDGAHYASFAPRAVFCRQWDWTFGSGQAVARTFGLFNDTHSAAPISFTRKLILGGKEILNKTTHHQAAPGANEKWDETLQLPAVDKRTEGEFRLALSVGGVEVYRDAKPVSVLPPVQAPVAGNIAVYDPNHTLSGFLKGLDQAFTDASSLAALPENAKVLLVAHQALTEADAASAKLAAWAAAGRAVVVLEQKNPLKFQALPCDMEPAQNEGRTAFAEDLDHPALQGLQQKDFFTWAPGSVVYRDAYLKPVRGAKSLIQCDEPLRCSALVEVPCGKGVLLLNQLLIGEKLASNAVAQTVLTGLLRYAASYQQEFLPVAAAVPANSQLARVLDAAGLRYSAAPDPLAALRAGKIVVIAATPENLEALAAQTKAVKQFTSAGGWLVFHGLTPEGLAAFDQLVGVEHIIRPFRRERVLFPPVKNHLTSGLTSGDVALYSSERIFPWQEGNYVADDTFTYCVDYDEVAPFAKMPSDYFQNMVNGMVSADGWKYIFSFELARGQQPQWDMEFPAEQELVEWTWIGNAFYHLVTRVEITFDGRETVAFDTQPNTEPQTFAIAPPRKAKKLRLKIADWQRVPNKGDVVGVDNLYFKARRSPEFYAKVKPMLNVGALMEYPQGQGGMVLCNVNFQASEPVPANGPKKQAILAAILRNLKAPFAGKTVIAGANLRYYPVDLSKHANAFRDEKGWFGDPKFTFKDLPTGRQTLAGVQFEIYDFPTSPVPTVLMLSDRASKPAREIRGIPVNRKADALFFLHTMKLDRPLNNDERRKKQRFETLRYLITYADGKTETVPVCAEIDIHDYHQPTPLAIPGAQIAWTRPYESGNRTAVAYARQWTNPRPDVEIKSLDMLPGANPRGTPALLAVTAANVE